MERRKEQEKTNESQKGTAADDALHLAFVSTYPPRACGIATFTQDLVRELEKVPGIAAPSVVAMEREPLQYGLRVRSTIREQERADYVRAAERLNASSVDVVVIEHEYGIYGGADGEYILDFARALEKPLVTTLHTVLPEPSANQRRILRELGRLSSRVVTMARRSRDLLARVYGIGVDRIEVIPHGVPLLKPSASKQALKQHYGLAGRSVMSTFGLLSEGKGIEYGIEAVAQVARRHPDLCYLVLGKTHPNIVAQEGERYREKLEGLVQQYGIAQNVRFVNRYLTKQEIVDYLALSDIYLTPYLGKDQAVSGTLAYAAGSGKAIVSTPYRYAEEMLADGRGLLAAFRDAGSIAAAVERILDAPEAARQMERKMRALGRGMFWDRVARKYETMFRAVLPAAQVRVAS